MKDVDQRDLAMILAIEVDLKKARQEERFEDVLHCLDEIFVHHMHTDSAVVRGRCSTLLRSI